MSIWEGADECPVCGSDLAETGECSVNDWHSNDVAIMRDGSRGVDLLCVYVEDAYAILGREIPADVERDLFTYRASYALSPLPMPSDEDLGNAADSLHDLATYTLESDLDSAGYVTDWDDGYVIYDARAYRGMGGNE